VSGAVDRRQVAIEDDAAAAQYEDGAGDIVNRPAAPQFEVANCDLKFSSALGDELEHKNAPLKTARRCV